MQKALNGSELWAKFNYILALEWNIYIGKQVVYELAEVLYFYWMCKELEVESLSPKLSGFYGIVLNSVFHYSRSLFLPHNNLMKEYKDL